jgi:hypothetical protein
VLSRDEAIELLRRNTDARRIDAGPDSATRIADLLGCLPLALGLVSGRSNANPDWLLTDHLTRLAERHRQLRLDDRVEIALGLSYQALRAGPRRLLLLLALHPGDDLDTHAAVAPAGADLDTAQAHLDELLASNLLQQKTSGRNECHDLVGIHAAALAINDEPASARRDSLTLLFDHYLQTASRAMDTYTRTTGTTDLRSPRRAPLPAVAQPAPARAWLAVEHHNPLTAAAYAAEHGWPAHTHRFAAILRPVLAGRPGHLCRPGCPQADEIRQRFTVRTTLIDGP